MMEKGRKLEKKIREKIMKRCITRTRDIKGDRKLKKVSQK